VGGSIAENLDSLYEYMSRRLLTANLQNSEQILQEVLMLLKDIRETWNEIGASSEKSAVLPAAPVQYDTLAPRSTTLFSA